jgi:hypothetical protein
MSDFVVVVHRRIKSQNWSQYRHWSAYKQERDAWFLQLRSKLPPVRPHRQKVHMRIRSLRTRLVDFANLVGGAKPIPDCLIKLGYLVDDSPKWLHCDYEQHQVPRAEERTELIFLATEPGEDSGDG